MCGSLAGGRNLVPSRLPFDKDSPRMRLLTGFAIVLLAAAAGVAADWPQWGREPGRNMVAEDAKGLPDSAKIAMSSDGEQVDVAKSVGVKWAAPLGSQTYG